LLLLLVLEYDIHDCSDNVTVSGKWNRDKGKVNRPIVNYGAGHVDDCSPDEVSRDETARD